MSEIKCINLGYVVPKDKADEVLELFKTHAAWMQEFYSDSNDGSTVSYTHLTLPTIFSL